MQQLLSKRATGLVKWPPEYIAKYCRTCGAELSGNDLDWMGDHGISTPSCVKCEEMEGGGVARKGDRRIQAQTLPRFAKRKDLFKYMPGNFQGVGHAAAFE